MLGPPEDSQAGESLDLARGMQMSTAGASVVLGWPSPHESQRLHRSMSEGRLRWHVYSGEALELFEIYLFFFSFPGLISSEMTFSLFILTGFYLGCKLWTHF